ncbi:MAG TPA: hypothetical protein VFE16_00955 [Candidatus Cybelea sp.]|jgi:hypothetical protein|nr:hypothetical protein [Candidatus Cybelea sp.]
MRIAAATEQSHVIFGANVEILNPCSSANPSILGWKLQPPPLAPRCLTPGQPDRLEIQNITKAIQNALIAEASRQGTKLLDADVFPFEAKVSIRKFAALKPEMQGISLQNASFICRSSLRARTLAHGHQSPGQFKRSLMKLCYSH